MSHTPGESDAAWTPERQVAYLRDEKGVSFDLVSERDAERFLAERTYFFKLKAFAKNFDKYESADARRGSYVNLDFGHLVELSRLDEKTRSLFLQLTLDIEHYVRVEINAAAMRAGVDPCQVSRSFLSASSEEVLRAQAETAPDDFLACLEDARSILEASCETREEAVVLANKLVRALGPLTGFRNPDHIRQGFESMKSSPFSCGLPTKYSYPSLPYWVCMETSSFGSLLKLYAHCLSKDGIIDDERGKRSYARVKPFLRRVKDARNASAHGDCLLNALSVRSTSARLAPARNALVSSYGLDEDIVNAVKSVRPAMDLAAIFICYDRIVPEGSTRGKAAELLAEASCRYAEKASWYHKTFCVYDFLLYASAISGLFADVFRG